MIGSFYYPWYSSENWKSKTARGHFEENQSPLLGWYDNINDKEIFRKHAEWCNQYGIDFLSLTYSKNSKSTVLKYFEWMKEFKINSPKLTVHIETLDFFDTNPVLYGTSDISKNLVYRSFRNEVRFICKNFVSDNYFKIDEKPVIMIYVTRRLPTYSLEIFEKIRKDIEENFGYNIFIMADDVFWKESDFIDDENRLYYFDVAYCYNPYVSENFFGNNKFIGNEYIDHVVDDLYDKTIWKDRFIPTIIPRYNDRGVRLDQDHYCIPDLDFEYFVNSVKPFYDKSGILLITSFNEWYEDTQIEPCVGNESSHSTYSEGKIVKPYGFECLEKIKKIKEELPLDIKYEPLSSFRNKRSSFPKIQEDRSSGEVKNMETLTNNLNVGAFYYIWFKSGWESKSTRGILDQPPNLGWYNSFDENVISQHIDWSNEYGIDFLIICVSKEMIESKKIGKFVNLYREICKNKEKFPKITFQIETLSFFNSPPPIKFASEDVKSLESFIDCITYLREIYDENLWHKIDGKPSIFIYAAREIKERCDLFCETIKDFWKTDIHISGDVIFHGYQPNDIVKCFDSLYYYNMYIHQIEVENVVDNTDKKIYDKYLDMVIDPLDRYFKSEKKMIIPSVIPRYNDRGIRIDKNHYVLPENRGMFFKQYLRRIKSYLKSNILLITSFNEWYEDTQIEPCGNKPTYGNSCTEPEKITEGHEHYSYYCDYLKIIKDFKDEMNEAETIESTEQKGHISILEKSTLKKIKFKPFDNSSFDVMNEEKIEIPLDFEFINPIIDVKNMFGENIFIFSFNKIVSDEQNSTIWFQIQVGDQVEDIDVNLLSHKIFIEYSPLVVDSEIKAITLKVYDNIHLNFEKSYKL